MYNPRPNRHKYTTRVYLLAHSTLVLQYFIHRTQLTTVAAFSTSSSPNNINSGTDVVSKKKNKIFCFGDSLTQGTSPPSFQEYPYSKHLEYTLNSIAINNDDQQTEQYMVRHYGKPGWTAKQLASSEGNLSPLLDRIQSSTNEYPSIVIILAGTNDLAYCSSENQCHDIFQSITKIHEICHKKNIDTIALSIPSSAWQSSYKNAAFYSKSINEKIETWAMETKTLATTTEKKCPIAHFVEFPIVAYVRSSGYWATDGLHFSPEGYSFIGKSLAPLVKNVMDLNKKMK